MSNMIPLKCFLNTSMTNLIFVMTLLITAASTATITPVTVSTTNSTADNNTANATVTATTTSTATANTTDGFGTPLKCYDCSWVIRSRVIIGNKEHYGSRELTRACVRPIISDVAQELTVEATRITADPERFIGLLVNVILSQGIRPKGLPERVTEKPSTCVPCSNAAKNVTINNHVATKTTSDAAGFTCVTLVGEVTFSITHAVKSKFLLRSPIALENVTDYNGRCFDVVPPIIKSSANFALIEKFIRVKEMCYCNINRCNKNLATGMSLNLTNQIILVFFINFTLRIST